MKNLTKIERLRIYQYMQKCIVEQPEVNYDPNVIDRTAKEMLNRVNFCRFIGDYPLVRNYIVSLQDFPELMLYKPFAGYHVNQDYWFHPLDKKSRENIINEVLKNMHISWWDRIVHAVRQIRW